MQNKKMFLVFFAVCGAVFFKSSYAEEITDVFLEEETAVVENIEDVSAKAIENYAVQGSLFQQITDLEQEKILMQLEKERAQLDLELDRLAAEKIKLHMEIDTLSGRAEQQQQEIETQKARLEAEEARLEQEKQRLQNVAEKTTNNIVSTPKSKEIIEDLSKKYRLVNVFGVGNQLQATIEDLESGQTKKISAGKKLDGWDVKSISLDDGIVFANENGETQNLNISNGK